MPWGRTAMTTRIIFCAYASSKYGDSCIFTNKAGFFKQKPARSPGCRNLTCLKKLNDSMKRSDHEKMHHGCISLTGMPFGSGLPHVLQGYGRRHKPADTGACP